MTENSKQNEVVDCPNHRDKICILRQLKKTKGSSGLVKSLKTETDDGLSSCANFPERPTLDEVQSDNPVLPEIEHLRGKLTDEHLEAIKDVLERNEEDFLRHKPDIGCCNFVEHEIELEENAVLHREGARRMTPHKSEACRKKIETLLEYDMIEPSKSPWACGVVMAKKKGDQLRFCCDFRYLNSVTVKDAYPIPRIYDSLSKLGDAKFFTTIDLGSAFWQVPLRKQDRDKTGFACELGLFQWKRMPFGLCNATSTFQRLMAHALIGVTKKYGNLIMCYVDDVVIATPTLEDHIERLDEVFACMKRSGLKCKSSKCEILNDSIKYLGRMVDRHGIKWIRTGFKEKGELEKDSYKIMSQFYKEKEDLLYHTADGVVACKRKNEEKILHRHNLIILPQLYPTEVLFRSHDQMGHQGIDKVQQRILHMFDWPGLRKACERWVNACLACLQVKDPRKMKFPLKSVESSEFNEVVQIDHQKICMTETGYNQILVIIDHFTKLAEAVPCQTASAEETCDHLITLWISRYGCPMTFQSDNGKAFVGDLTKELM